MKYFRNKLSVLSLILLIIPTIALGWGVISSSSTPDTPTNYYGNGELGDVTFSTGSITQTNDSVAIDSVLTTGSEAGGSGASSYGSGDNTPPASNVYEFTVPSKSGAYDGDMFVAQFKSLTIDASVWLTVDQPSRGLLVYVDGDCTIAGTLSMSCRGAFADPTAAGGSDASAVSATGIRLPLFKTGETDTLAAADLAGCGSPAVAAVANQAGVSNNGLIFTASRAGSAGGAGGSGYWGNGTAGTGSEANKTGGGGGGGSHDSGTGGAGSTGSCFSGGTGGGSADGAGATSGTAYGGQGGHGAGGGVGTGGTGNPGGTGDAYAGKDGTGGLLILIVKGDLTITGSILSKGTGLTAVSGTGPGSSGGGRIGIFYAGSLTDSGTKNAAGGPTQVGNLTGNGGAGGAGAVDGPTQIDL